MTSPPPLILLQFLLFFLPLRIEEGDVALDLIVMQLNMEWKKLIEIIAWWPWILIFLQMNLLESRKIVNLKSSITSIKRTKTWVLNRIPWLQVSLFHFFGFPYTGVADLYQHILFMYIDLDRPIWVMQSYRTIIMAVTQSKRL